VRRILSVPQGRDARLLLLVPAAILVLWVGFRGALATERFLDADELVHMNAAWFVSRGETIYVDFFENHPPLMALLLQPVVRSSGSAEVLIDRGRALVFLLGLAILLAVADLAHRVDGTLAAWTAPALLAGHTFFVQKTLEIRPDVPALLLFCLALCALARGVGSRSWRWPFFAGALLCAAGLFTPKVIYAAAGASAAAALAAAESSPRRGALQLGWILLGGAAVAGLAFAEMAREGILAGFFADAVQQSLRITIDDPGRFRWLYLKTTAWVDGALWSVAAAGALIAWRRSSPPARGELWILAGSFLAGGLAPVLISAPMRQVFLPLLPAAAVFGSLGLVAGARAIATRYGNPAAAGALLLALLAIAAAPFGHLARTTPPMDRQLRILEQVLEASGPGERVFDCFSGLYLTRLHAHRYFYLNSDIQRLLAPEELERGVSRALEDPAVRLVLMDRDCRRLPAPVQRSIRNRFAPLRGGNGFIWARKGPAPAPVP
jgi:4-amino-4-deoxy-L-arabinose transferase-like glycosyltransferase